MAEEIEGLKLKLKIIVELRQIWKQAMKITYSLKQFWYSHLVKVPLWALSVLVIVLVLEKYLRGERLLSGGPSPLCRPEEDLR